MAYCNGNDCYAQVNTQISFTDKSTNSPTTWHWDFGDGTTSTLQNPTHAYTQEGDYTVIHTASNSCGSGSCYNKIIHVSTSPPPPPPSSKESMPFEYLAAAGLIVVAVGLTLLQQSEQLKHSY